jgi:DNA-binding SARP family transcriptional activator
MGRIVMIDKITVKIDVEFLEKECKEHIEAIRKEAFEAGVDCSDYIQSTGVPWEDAFDQWVEYNTRELSDERESKL